MYTRRFTSLKWYDQMKAHVNLRMKPPPEYFHIFEQNPPFSKHRGDVPKAFYKVDVDRILTKDLIEKYPDLMYTNAFHTINKNSVSSGQGNYIYDFVACQRKLLNDGYTKEKAFELTEKKFQERFSNKIESVQIATRLALNNNARSMLSIAQQQAEFEANLKVKRMTRDIPLYQEAQREMNQSLKSLEKERLDKLSKAQRQEEEGEGEEEQNDELNEYNDAEQSNKSAAKLLDPSQRYAAEYTRVLHKIVPEAKEDYTRELTKDKRTKIINSFIENTKNMFSRYYERAATLDKLSGLTDNEIMDAVASNPKRIKKQSRQLLKKLEKYNIKLDNYGEVDFSECSEPNVVNQLKNNPLVKVVLLQADLEFESPHREAQLAAAKRAKLDIEEFRKEREIETKEIEQEVQNAWAIENASTGEQSSFHQQYNIEYPRAESSFIKEVKETAKEKASKFIQGGGDVISMEAAYKVFETYEERVTRLEKKWLQSRLASLEGGLEKPTQEERSQLLDKAVNKLRRLKFLVDQKNLQNAKDLLFEEHRVFSESEILIDESANVEKLVDYLRLPEEKRRLQSVDEIDDNRIMNMIRRKEVVEDTLRPYKDNFAYMRTEKDTFEAKMERVNNARLGRLSEGIGRRIEQERSDVLDGGREGLESDDDVVETDTSSQKGKGKGKGKSRASKMEKRKLIDFIKETSEKKVAKEVKKDAKKGK